MTIASIERLSGMVAAKIKAPADPRERVKALLTDYLADDDREFMDVASGVCQGGPAVLITLGQNRHLLMANEATVFADVLDEVVTKHPDNEVNDEVTDLILILRHAVKSAIECYPQLTSSSSASSSAS